MIIVAIVALVILTFLAFVMLGLSLYFQYFREKALQDKLLKVIDDLLDRKNAGLFDAYQQYIYGKINKTFADNNKTVKTMSNIMPNPDDIKDPEQVKIPEFINAR